MPDPTELIALASAGFCLVGFGLYRLSRGVASRLPIAIVEPFAEGRGTDVRRIFWTALAIRLVAGLLIAATNSADFFAPDRWGYETIGRAIAAKWAGQGFMTASVSAEARLYHYYNAVFFYLAGDAGPWFVRTLNSVAGAATVLLVHHVAKLLYGRETARRAAWLVALFPSMVLWSALNIRDAWAGLAILITVWAAMRLRERIALDSAALLVGGLALLGGMRGYMFLLIAASLVLSYVAAVRGSVIRNYVAGLIVVLAFLYLYSSLGFGKQMVDTASFETLNSQRQGMTVAAASSFYEHVDISTPGKALAFLPIGMTFFLFAPFPWMVKKFSQAITQPEMIVWWYLAFRYVLPGIREGLRVRAAHTLTVCSVTLISVMAYGLVEGNVGTAYRHRAQVLPLLLILAAGGWTEQRRSEAARRDERLGARGVDALQEPARQERF